MLLVIGLVALALPAPAMPAGHAQAKCQALADQGKMHAQMRAKARHSKKQTGLGGAAGPAPAPLLGSSPGAKPPRLNLAKTGLLLLLAGSSGMAGLAQGTVPMGPLGVLPGFNLSAPTGSTALAAQGVQLALARANGTGALPSLVELNALLAAVDPSNSSPLATLPAPGSAPEPPLLSITDTLLLPNQLSLPSNLAGSVQSMSAGNQTSSSRFNDEMVALLAVLNVAQLTEAYYLQASIGLQLLADASLFTENPTLAGALNFAGNELLSLGHATAALGSQLEVDAAQYALAALIKRNQTRQATPGEPGPALASALVANPDSPAGILDPSLVYGSWQRVENQPSGQFIMYKVTRNELVKINATTDPDGVEAIRTECHPGSVVGYVSYRRPTGSLALEDSLGKVKVTLVVEKSNGNTMSLEFSFLRARDAANSQAVDVLVEEDGEKKAFLRVSRF